MLTVLLLQFRYSVFQSYSKRTYTATIIVIISMQHELPIFCSLCTDFFIPLLISHFPYPHSSLLIFSHRGTSIYPFTAIPVPLAQIHFWLQSVTATPAIHNWTISVSVQFPIRIFLVFYFSHFLISFFYLPSSPSLFQSPSYFPSAQSFPSWVFLTSIHFPYYDLFIVFCLNRPWMIKFSNTTTNWTHTHILQHCWFL